MRSRISGVVEIWRNEDREDERGESNGNIYRQRDGANDLGI